MGPNRVPFNLRARMWLKHGLMSFFTRHVPDGRPDILIFSTPRSGSTWLMEMLLSQPGYRYCDEPFNLRTASVRIQLGLQHWDELYRETNLERLAGYLRGFSNGRPVHAKLKHVLPASRLYRPVTHAIVFKILHAGEDRIEWLGQQLNARIVYLIRHPVPVSLSRRCTPRLESFIRSEYARHFRPDQLETARRVIKEGSALEKGVLSWCFQNAIPLKSRQPHWFVVSYEQLVLQPETVISAMAGSLGLPDPYRMLSVLNIPSTTTWQSDESTRQRIGAAEGGGREWMISKWRRRVNGSEERRVMELLKLFEIHAYRAGSDTPADALWIGRPAADKGKT